MNLGVQYYRAPFPNERYWEDDFARIRESGLNTVQLWVLWSWVEARPGEFQFDDYDRLVELAEKNALGVILSTIAEVQPCWIHREVPDSEMIDHLGRKVVSSNRCECHFGITPGGCTDHPGVRERMSAFLRTVVERYRTSPVLRGWDAWNELRWNVHSDGLVCFCPHTLRAFRDWLSDRYGGLDGLNRAWIRRYGSWDEVMPGKLSDRPYTEMMAFEHFLTWRANQHAKARYETMKALDPNHPITVHAGVPSPMHGGGENNHAVNRGNDWFFADDLDGVGCSSFPKWGGLDDADFGMRVECVKSAARDKLVWLSEVQGGRSAVGFDIHAAVDAASQQRWIWNGLACGADTILFWCWRDEVFGRESAGFGLAGNDGLAGERLEAMRFTGALLDNYRDLVANYRPARPEVGILFSPQSYYLTWAQERTAGRAVQALRGYARALVRKSIPCAIVEEEHLDALDGLRLLFLPRTIVVDDATVARLKDFVHAGGTLVCESECGAFDSRGLYRYPEDRFLMDLAGVREAGRRHLAEDSVRIEFAGDHLTLGMRQWMTPWVFEKGRTLAAAADGALIAEVPVGKGRLVLCGSYFGDAYLQEWSSDFERFVELIARDAGRRPEIEALSPRATEDAFVYVKHGRSEHQNVVFVFAPSATESVHLRFRPDFFASTQVQDLISGQMLTIMNMAEGQECLVPAAPWRLAVLVGK